MGKTPLEVGEGASSLLRQLQVTLFIPYMVIGFQDGPTLLTALEADFSLSST